MPDLILVAASGLAREALSVVALTSSHRVLGFVDDDPGLSGSMVAGLPILGSLAELKKFDRADLLVCVGSGSARKRLVQRLADAGVAARRYATIIHPSIQVPVGCVIGRGSILLAHVVLTADVSIGHHVVVMPNGTLTHDNVVGDYATLCAGVCLGGHVTVGEAAYLGMGASVRETVCLGADATLGMGSVLLRDLPPRQTWAGVPAAPIASAARDSL